MAKKIGFYRSSGGGRPMSEAGRFVGTPKPKAAKKHKTKPAGTGPHPSASAIAHASPNARFKRGTTGPVKKGGKRKVTPVPGPIGHREGAGSRGTYPGTHLGAPEQVHRSGSGRPSSGSSTPRPGGQADGGFRRYTPPKPQASPNPGMRPKGDQTRPGSGIKVGGGFLGRVGSPKQAVPGSGGTNTGALGAPKRLGAPAQVTKQMTGRARPSASAIAHASPNASFKRGAPNLTPPVVPGSKTKKITGGAKPGGSGDSSRGIGRPIPGSRTSSGAPVSKALGQRKRGTRVSVNV